MNASNPQDHLSTAAALVGSTSKNDGVVVILLIAIFTTSVLYVVCCGGICVRDFIVSLSIVPVALARQQDNESEHPDKVTCTTTPHPFSRRREYAMASI
jgi:hypothetical protein